MELIIVLQLNSFHDFQGWFSMWCSYTILLNAAAPLCQRCNVYVYHLRTGSFQIRELITNKNKQADDLFHGELIFITEQKEVCQHISLSLKCCIVFGV